MIVTDPNGLVFLTVTDANWELEKPSMAFPHSGIPIGMGETAAGL